MGFVFFQESTYIDGYITLGDILVKDFGYSIYLYCEGSITCFLSIKKGFPVKGEYTFIPVGDCLGQGATCISNGKD